MAPPAASSKSRRRILTLQGILDVGMASPSRITTATEPATRSGVRQSSRPEEGATLLTSVNQRRFKFRSSALSAAGFAVSPLAIFARAIILRPQNRGLRLRMRFALKLLAFLGLVGLYAGAATAAQPTVGDMGSVDRID